MAVIVAMAALLALTLAFVSVRDGRCGTLEWVAITDLVAGWFPVWEGDRHFLPLVFTGRPTFHGVMPYATGRPTSWTYSQL